MCMMWSVSWPVFVIAIGIEEGLFLCVSNGEGGGGRPSPPVFTLNNKRVRF